MAQFLVFRRRKRGKGRLRLSLDNSIVFGGMNVNHQVLPAYDPHEP